MTNPPTGLAFPSLSQKNFSNSLDKAGPSRRFTGNSRFTPRPMKITPLLLLVSLAANAALIAVVATRSKPAAPAPVLASPQAGSAARDSDHTSVEALRAALASGDLAALQAAGLPADLARDLGLGRAFARYQQLIKAARTAVSDDGRWWRTGATTRNREAELLAQRELSDAMLKAFGDDLGLGGADSAQLAFLPAEKRAALRRITQDYNEMMAKFSSGGIQLASDKEKLRLLRAERDRDIAALLSPAELADYELRTSSSAATLRARYGDAIATEADFKKLFALQKAYDEKFPAEPLGGRVSPETLRARSDAQKQLQADILAAVGDDAYAALRRSADTELRALDSLVTRVGLPATTTDRVAAARETYAAESQRINADTALSVAQRRAQLQELGTRARTELTATLGAEAAEAFAPRASWVGMLQGGLAFSTTPTTNSPGGLSLGGAQQSVYPVMPAGTPGATGAPGTRQVVNIVSSSTENFGGTPGPGGLNLGGGGPAYETSGTFQVISVGNPTPTPPSPTPPPATATPPKP